MSIFISAYVWRTRVGPCLDSGAIGLRVLAGHLCRASNHCYNAPRVDGCHAEGTKLNALPKLR